MTSVSLALIDVGQHRRGAARRPVNGLYHPYPALAIRAKMLSETMGTEQDPAWVLVNAIDGSAVVFGLEHLPVGFSDSAEDTTIYAEAVADAFGPEGANEIKIDFDTCVPATVDGELNDALART